MSQDNPKVSVIIPVYNTEKYLRECLDSVVNQTLKDIEIICVDDGSTDSSPEILREYAAKGIKGIKADFFDSEDQITMSDLREIYRICAEAHLMLNCHSAGKPTGERIPMSSTGRQSGARNTVNTL